MSRGWGKGFWVLVLAGGIAAGFIPWRVTGLVRRFLNGAPQSAGWSFQVDQARWTPWRSLQLDQVQIQTPGNGRLRVVEAKVFLRLRPLLHRRFRTEWVLGEIRIDPVSWMIRRGLAQEILSVMPVTQTGFGTLEVGPQEVRIDPFSLSGPVLQLGGQAVFGVRREIHLQLEGDLSRTILEAMQVLSSRNHPEPWQPFKLQLDGRIDAPRIQFESNFHSFVLD